VRSAIILAALACLIFVLGVFFLLEHEQGNGNQGKICVVCTISMIADAAQKIGGPFVNVICLMGPGIDPHLYRAKEGDVHRLASADLILYSGLHLEGKITDVLEAMKQYTTVRAVTDYIPRSQLLKIEGYEDLYDPHIWFDVTLWQQAVCAVRDALISVDCDELHQRNYIQRTVDYIHELDMVHSYVQTQAATLNPTERILVTAHDAFRYFGRAYGFQVIGLQGISTDADIGIKDIQELASCIQDHRIRAIFVESCIPRRTIQALQYAVRLRGWHVIIGDSLFSDALGDIQQQAGTYSGMIRHNIDAIVAGLKA
jgi:manganese/zinc/iron transport system substrate-binding protein